MTLVAGGALGEPREGSVRLVVQSSPLAAFRYYDAAKVWPDLRLGDELELERQAENPHDAAAVAVSWRGRMLGYVPRRKNAAVAWAMDRGERLRARISRLAAHPNPARRLEFEVYIE